MTYSLYDVSVPIFINQIKAIANVFDSALAFCEANNIDPDAMLRSRLYPNMFDLAMQIRAMCFQAMAGPSIVAGREQATFSRIENTVPELKKLMKDTVAYLEGIKPSEMEGAADRTFEFQTPTGMKLPYKGRDLLLQFSQPNFYFHATTAYGLIRQMGVDIGKRHFMGKA